MPERPPARLLFLISDLGTGGTARATLHVVNGLAAAGVEVSLMVMRGVGVLTELLDQRVRLVVARANRERGVGLLLAVPEIVGLIRSWRATMVISSGNHMHLVATMAQAIARVPSCALALKMTNPVERPNKGRLANAVRRAWYGWAFGRADKILVIADATRKELVKQYPRIEPKLRVVDNPYITPAMIDAGRNAEDFEAGRLLAIGRLVPQKDYPLLLRALAHIRELDWTLDILGDGPLLKALERQAATLEISDRIRFRGFVTDPVPYLRKAHALVLSSAWEGQGAVLLEALACACPVIATCSTEAVSGVLGNGLYGRLIPAGDVEALAAAIALELRRRSVLPPSTPAWVGRYRIDAGVRSHAEALGVELTDQSTGEASHDRPVRETGPRDVISAHG